MKTLTWTSEKATMMAYMALPLARAREVYGLLIKSSRTVGEKVRLMEVKVRRKTAFDEERNERRREEAKRARASHQVMMAVETDQGEDRSEASGEE